MKILSILLILIVMSIKSLTTNKTVKYNNCNVLHSKVIFLLLSKYKALDINKVNNMESARMKEFISLIYKIDKTNRNTIGHFKCEDCNKSYIKKEFLILHSVLNHIDKFPNSCFGDYCNIYNCNKVKEYLKNDYNNYFHSTDNKVQSYNQINQRKISCNSQMITNYKQICLLTFKNQKNRFSYCNKITCSESAMPISYTFKSGMLLLKYVSGFLITIFIIIYLVISWLNRYF